MSDVITITSDNPNVTNIIELSRLFLEINYYNNVEIKSLYDLEKALLNYSSSGPGGSFPLPFTITIKHTISSIIELQSTTFFWDIVIDDATFQIIYKTYQSKPCFVAGSLILTPTGYK